LHAISLIFLTSRFFRGAPRSEISESQDVVRVVHTSHQRQATSIAEPSSWIGPQPRIASWDFWEISMLSQRRPLFKLLSATALTLPLLAVSLSAPTLAHDDDHDDNHGRKSPKVVIISLDGAKPDLIRKYLDEGVLPRDGGLAKLSRGVVARQNVTATPSLTA